MNLKRDLKRIVYDLNAIHAEIGEGELDADAAEALHADLHRVRPAIANISGYLASIAEQSDVEPREVRGAVALGYLHGLKTELLTNALESGKLNDGETFAVKMSLPANEVSVI